ncbi:MAG: DegT/DnrJ/EryC1/StrS family aminotransferase, partial [Alphaproteobacteria bacterium]|nr:DegT/DnrJ/EryC1/StrS family aminotransferase [Alphaproteobacteria bacterium]
SQLEAAMTDRTRMIVGVSILGNPAALDVMRDFAESHGLYFFEDNCESLDAELGGKKTGSFGDMATHSFFFSHHIATMEGGMVVTDDEEYAHLLRSLRAHGWTRDLPADSPVFKKRGDDFYEAYRFILPGYNVRSIEMSGAIGLVQLDKLPDMTKARRRNLAHFQSRFGDDPRFIIQRENGASSSFCFPIILNPERNPDRDAVFAALSDGDIGYRIITGGCITRHDVVEHYDYEVVGALTNAEIVHDFGFFVGNHPFDLTPQIDRVYEILDSVVS